MKQRLFDPSQLKNLLHHPNLGRLDYLLLILAAHADPLRVAEIRKIGTDNGKRQIGKWNISDILGRSEAKALLIGGAWEIQEKGVSHIRTLDIPIRTSSLVQPALELRKILQSQSTPETRSFLEEAIECYERKLFRAAVVLSWQGAVYALHDYTLKRHRVSFNKAGQTRFKDKFKPVKSIEQFGRLQEADFLQLLEDSGMIGKSVKKQLSQRLDLRNDCGHPNKFKVADHTVASHLEILMTNVFQPFG